MSVIIVTKLSLCSSECQKVLFSVCGLDELINSGLWEINRGVMLRGIDVVGQVTIMLVMRAFHTGWQPSDVCGVAYRPARLICCTTCRQAALRESHYRDWAAFCSYKQLSGHRVFSGNLYE